MNAEVVHATLQWLLVYPGAELHIDVILSLVCIKKNYRSYSTRRDLAFIDLDVLDRFFWISTPGT